MNHRRGLVVLGANAVLFSSFFAGCGSYEDSNSATSTSSSAVGPVTSAAAVTTGGDATMAGMTSTSGDAAASSTTGAAAANTTGDAAQSTTGAASTTGDAVTTTGGDSTGAGGASSTTGAGTSTTGAVDASCENVTGCGGEVVGTWAVAGSCLEVSGLADMTGNGLGCTESPSEGNLSVTGMITFNADGTLVDNTTTTANDIGMTLADTCLEISGTVTQCDRIGIPLTDALGYATVACVDDETTGGCTCVASGGQEGGIGWVDRDLRLGDPNDGATYTTADTTLSLSEEAENLGHTLDYTYCVDGDYLTLTPATPNNVGDVAGTIVLQRQ